MANISFSLVRKQYPDISDEVSCSQLKILRLDGLKLQSMSGCLDLFHQIEELSLSHNNIDEIDDITFLINLSSLDLSFNNISSESLRASIGNLPSGLAAINLLNNPCCEDEDILVEYQAKYPSLGIIIGYADDDVVDEIAGLIESAEIVVEEDATDLTRYQPLDADIVLKSLVDRKCRQEDSSLDINDVVNVSYEMTFIMSKI